MRYPGRLLIWLVPVALAACGDHDDYYYPAYGPPPPGTYANFQVVNGSPDAPPIDLQIDGTTFIRKLDYGQGTAEQSITPTSHSLVVQIETPGGPTAIVGPMTLDAAANMDYVVAVEGNVTNGITAVVFPHQLAGVPGDSAQIQVLNAAAGSPLYVYLTAPGADLTASAPLGMAPFEGSIGPTQVTAGAWEIRITQSSSASALVLYDSGTITLEGGSDLVIAILALPAETLHLPSPGSQSLQLAAVDAQGQSAWFPAVGTPTLLRVVHDSPDAPALAVVANSNVTTPLVATLAYEASTAYLSETAGEYDLAITPASNLSDVLANRPLKLSAGTAHSLYAMGPLAQLFPFVTQDSNRRYADLARLRFIQGAPSANRVDVYLTASGAAITSATPTYSGLPFTADTGFVSYTQGSYDLTVTGAGSKTPIIGPVAVALQNNGIYTAVARDAPGGGAPFGLISLDDL
jgi:hypothetical protein